MRSAPWPTRGFANSPEPLALILREIGQGWAARILGVSAVIALPTVILAFFYGQSRIFFVMARDGLLPGKLANVSKRGTPVRITLFTADRRRHRRHLPARRHRRAGQCRHADGLHRGLRGDAGDAPARAGCAAQVHDAAPWLVGIVGILGCAYLFMSLPAKTQTYFLVWNIGGLVLYGSYGRRWRSEARANA